MFNTLASLTRRGNTLFRILAEPGLYGHLRSGAIPMTYLELKQPWLLNLGLRTVLDIGANAGAFARTALALFTQARVHAFEPLLSMHVALDAIGAAHPRFSVHKVGLGESDGELTFYQTPQDVSSSFLEPTAVYDQLTGTKTTTTALNVPVRRLDDIAQTANFETPMLIKLDVQGFEDRVIRGGARTFQRAHAVLMETSAIPQYADALSFRQMIDVMDDLGFDYAGVIERVVTSKSGRIVSEDMLFSNRTLLPHTAL
jgi:FkbM family methyltransferase